MKTKEFYDNYLCICDRCSTQFKCEPSEEEILIYQKQPVGDGSVEHMVHIDLCPECQQVIKERLETEMEVGKKGEISFWEEFQHMLYDSTNAQAEEAIKILQEKLKKNGHIKTASNSCEAMYLED